MHKHSFSRNRPCTHWILQRTKETHNTGRTVNTNRLQQNTAEQFWMWWTVGTLAESSSEAGVALALAGGDVQTAVLPAAHTTGVEWNFWGTRVHVAQCTWEYYTVCIVHGACCVPAHRIGQQHGPTAENNQTWKKCRESSKAPPYRAPLDDLSPPSYPCSKQTQQGKTSRTTGVIYLGSTGHLIDTGDSACIYF